MIVCKVCDVNPPVAKQRCITCYRYWKRNGRERPNATERAIGANERWLPKHLRDARKALRMLDI